MMLLNPKDALTVTQALQLLEDMSNIAFAHGFDPEITINPIDELQEYLAEFREAGGFDEGEILATEQFDLVYMLYKPFMELFANAYEEALEQCINLKQQVQMRIDQLGDSVANGDTAVTFLEQEHIVDPFQYSNYLDERYNQLSHVAAMFAIKRYIKKPTLSVIKKGVH